MADRAMAWVLVRGLLLGMLAMGNAAAPGQGRDSYRNPVLAGDYSDADAIRVGDRYFLVASSFTNVPGLPVLESRDLVNWTLIGHALPAVPPFDHFSVPRRGGGVWAPAIRFHAGRFLIYYADPDHGVFMVSAADPRGPWTAPVLVDDAKGAIDPCPFWDDDGRAWLVHAWAASRAGINNVITIKPLSADGRSVTGQGRTMIDGDRTQQVRTSIGMRPWQTTEGPKLYKRAGWYYLFVPSGSVKGGWQGVFRSRTIDGEYEGRDVLDQGPTQINGPHQGAWVTTPAGADWFLHFSDADSYGRRVFLEPMAWKDGWPVIGVDPDGDGIGQPVLQHKRPALAGTGQPDLADRGETVQGKLDFGWQWSANPSADWADLPASGGIRLKSISAPANLWETGSLLTRKLPAERFEATTRMVFSPLRDGERAGLAMFGSDYAWIGAERRDGAMRIVEVVRKDADRGGVETRVEGPVLKSGALWLRFVAEPVTVRNPPPDFSPWWPAMLRSTHAAVRFSYSLDGTHFTSLGGQFVSRPGRWTGAQVGIFAQASAGTPAFTATSVGSALFDGLHFQEPQQ